MRLPPLLRENVGFRRLWCSQTVSIAGDHVGLVALPLVGVLALHAGAAQMGLLTAAAWAPSQSGRGCTSSRMVVVIEKQHSRARGRTHAVRLDKTSLQR